MLHRTPKQGSQDHVANHKLGYVDMSNKYSDELNMLQLFVAQTAQKDLKLIPLE